jgi:hypothetical protein
MGNVIYAGTVKKVIVGVGIFNKYFLHSRLQYVFDLSSNSVTYIQSYTHIKSGPL